MYDYVIVGAGSAGCVLASRLSENPSTRVLLLEAGPPDDADEIAIPAAVNLLFQSTYDWDYRTVPQERAGNRVIYWPRGRVLGGSSSINAMIYIRGSRHDYDTWRDEYGCAGWGYADLMPYFKRSEGNSRGAGPYHGGTGPLRVSDLSYKSALTKAFVAAAQECGLPANEDFNGAQQDGCGFYQVTQENGRRCSAAAAYLRSAMVRPNLEVRTDTRVTKVLVEAGRATGVRYLVRGEEEFALAEAEVILAAGALGSPHLLLLSGIGPAEHLRDMGIPVLVDSPGVGANLSDHPVVPILWHTPRTEGLWEKNTPASLARWRFRHSGPLTSNVAESGGFTRTRPSLLAPDVQFVALPVPFQGQGLADPHFRALSVLVTLLEVGSRGRVYLRSADPRHKPAVDPAYLSEGTDIEPLVEGIRMAREFAAAGPLAKICTTEHSPGAEMRTDTEVRQYIRGNLGTLFHPVGTCAMGGNSRLSLSKLTSVVDPELRVRGVESLRVVDASVMPTVPRGNTNAPTIAIAERAADLIIGRAPLEPADPATEPGPAPAQLG